MVGLLSDELEMVYIGGQPEAPDNEVDEQGEQIAQEDIPEEEEELVVEESGYSVASNTRTRKSASQLAVKRRKEKRDNRKNKMKTLNKN